MSDHLMQTYNREKVTFTHGKGVWLWDSDDNKYLDALAGIAVVNLGHSHPQITQTISEQAGKLMQISNGFKIREQEDLAKTLAELSGMENAFFCNSGAEANETAIKMVRKYANDHNIKNAKIITMHKSFHGRTMANISASGNQKIQTGFTPLLEGFIYCDYNDIKALKNLIAEHQNEIVAIMLEPIQGEGGINIPDTNYLNATRDICDKHGYFMILDEVQTGMGRTGKFLCYQHNNIVPDILTLAKALGNGYPIGACLAQGKAAEIFNYGNHGTTFGGNPMACKVASKVIEIMRKPEFLEHVNQTSAYLMEKLQSSLKSQTKVINIRNKGLLVGIELDKEYPGLRAKGLERKIVFSVTAKKVIRLAPPLIIEKAEVDLLVDTISKLLNSI
ncbi:MAG: aspartate aminotransferase family protein [Legionellales bacterium]|nr:MAG: aspartate aminotransferase family protein [Legionellales bacterium]